MTSTRTLIRTPVIDEPKVDRCSCGAPLRARNRWGAPLSKTSPDNLAFEHIEETFQIHPWLRGTRLAALIENLHDAVVMNL